jgi:hypothetical protein
MGGFMTQAEKWMEKIEAGFTPEMSEALDEADWDGFYHAGHETGFTTFEDGSGLACFPCFGWSVFTAEEMVEIRKEVAEYIE